MSDENKIADDLAVEAAGLLIGLRGMHGENLLMFREPEYLARLCEINAELADWIRARSQFSVVAEWSWRHTKSHLESRAASRAFEGVVKASGVRTAKPRPDQSGHAGDEAAA